MRGIINGRRLALVGAMMIAGIALSGCSAVSHVSAELKNGTVQFFNCEAFTFDSVDVAVMSKESPNKTRTMWHSDGPSAISGPVQVTYGVDPSGFSSSSGPRNFDPRTSRIGVLFASSSPDPGAGLTATFDGAKLVEGRWLNWNGNLVSAPCRA